MRLLRLAHTHARIVGRQKALWLATLPLTAFGTLLALASPQAPHTRNVVDLAHAGQWIGIFSGIAFAAVFADFFTAPTRLGMPEVEACAPVTPLTLRAARLLGAFAVVITPALVVLLGLGIWQTIEGDPWSIPGALGVTATIVAPMALIAMALSGLAGTLLPRAVSRIVAVLVWFWLWLYTPLLPILTLNGTILSVIGDPVAEGYFGSTGFYPPPLGVESTPVTATLSLLWQLVLVVALLAAGSVLAERVRKR